MSRWSRYIVAPATTPPTNPAFPFSLIASRYRRSLPTPRRGRRFDAPFGQDNATGANTRVVGRRITALSRRRGRRFDPPFSQNAPIGGIVHRVLPHAQPRRGQTFNGFLPGTMTVLPPVRAPRHTIIRHPRVGRFEVPVAVPAPPPIPAPCIKLPTSATIHAYGSAVGIRSYQSSIAIRRYSSSVSIKVYTSAVAVTKKTSNVSITTRTGLVRITNYTSFSTLRSPCG